MRVQSGGREMLALGLGGVQDSSATRSLEVTKTLDRRTEKRHQDQYAVLIHEQPAIAGVVPFKAHLPKSREQRTNPPQPLQPLHVLITSLTLPARNHAGHDTATIDHAQLAPGCLPCPTCYAQMPCRTGLPGRPTRASGDGAWADPLGSVDEGVSTSETAWRRVAVPVLTRPLRGRARGASCGACCG